MEELIASQNHIILSRIFLHLDGQSLKNARLVAKSWNDYIKRKVWLHPFCRDILEQRLDQMWTTHVPAKATIKCPSCVFDVTMDSFGIVVSSEDGQVQEWDRKSLEVMQTYSKPGPDHGIRIALTKDYIFGGFFDKQFYVWRREVGSGTNKTMPILAQSLDCNIHGIKVMGNDIIVSVVSGDILIYTWRSSVSQTGVTLRHSISGTVRTPSHVAVEGRWMLYTSTRRQLNLFDLIENQIVMSLGHSRPIWCVKLRYPLAAITTPIGACGPGVVFWNLVTGVKVHQINVSDLETINMDAKRLIVLTATSIRMVQLSDILSRSQGSKKVPVHVVTKLSNQRRSDLVEAALAPDELIYQSDVDGTLKILNFWLSTQRRVDVKSNTSASVMFRFGNLSLACLVVVISILSFIVMGPK